MKKTIDCLTKDKNNLVSTYKKETFQLMKDNSMPLELFLGIELNKIYFYHPIKTINETNKSISSIFSSLKFNAVDHSTALSLANNHWSVLNL